MLPFYMLINKLNETGGIPLFVPKNGFYRF